MHTTTAFRAELVFWPNKQHTQHTQNAIPNLSSKQSCSKTSRRPDISFLSTSQSTVRTSFTAGQSVWCVFHTKDSVCTVFVFFFLFKYVFLCCYALSSAIISSTEKSYQSPYCSTKCYLYRTQQIHTFFIINKNNRLSSNCYFPCNFWMRGLFWQYKKKKKLKEIIAEKEFKITNILSIIII